MRKIGYFCVVLLAITAIGGCKLRIQSTANGSVESASGSNDCAQNQVCTIDVIDIFFDDTFTANPASGYVFGGWKRADKYFCGGRNDPCRLYTSGFEGQDALLAFLESDDVFFLSPDFIKPVPTLVGQWSGEWRNTTFGSTGAITVAFSQPGSNSLTVDFDVDGNAFGQSDPPPSSVTLTLNDAHQYNVQIDFNGSALTFTVSLDDDGTLELGIPNLPASGLESFEATGSLTRNRIKLDYQVNFSSGPPALGTIDLRKS